MAEQFVMTQESYDRLKEELDKLLKERPEIVERIDEARSHGDLSENAEYDAAREAQRTLEAQIVELDNKIKNAVIQEVDTDNTYVHLNSVVKVYDEDMEEEVVYTVVSVVDVDVMNNKISVESPVGSALLKRKKGEKVTVTCPDGSSYQLKILKIS